MLASPPDHDRPRVARRSWLLAAGWTDDAVRAQLDARRWQALNEQVICQHNGPLTPEDLLHAAVLSARDPVALCAWTGMKLWGVTGVEADVPHIVVPRGARPLAVAGAVIRVHESRRFGDDDVSWRQGLPVTSLPRSTLDAAAWTRSSKAAARIFVAPVQQRLTSPRLLQAELDRAGQVRHGRWLRALAVDLDGGAQALSEVAFLAFCRRHGLPRPATQHREDSRGRRRYLDAIFPRPDGTLLRVEIDGGVHLDLTTRWRDTAKDNESGIAGRVVLRFPSVAIYTDDPEAVDQLRRAIGQTHPGR